MSLGGFSLVGVVVSCGYCIDHVVPSARRAIYWRSEWLNYFQSAWRAAGRKSSRIPAAERAFFPARALRWGAAAHRGQTENGRLSDIFRQFGNGFLNLYQQVGIGDLALAQVKVVIKARY